MPSTATGLIDKLFAIEDEMLLCGVRKCAPCRPQIDAYPVHETMSVISGSVSVTDPGGNSGTITAGDVFFIPKGTPVGWEITERPRMFDMIAE